MAPAPRCSTRSRPFAKPAARKIAVKVVNVFVNVCGADGGTVVGGGQAPGASLVAGDDLRGDDDAGPVEAAVVVQGRAVPPRPAQHCDRRDHYLYREYLPAAALDRVLGEVRAGIGSARPGRCLIVLGRRRIGKSALVEEFVRLNQVPYVFYTAEVGESDLPEIRASVVVFDEVPYLMDESGALTGLAAPQAFDAALVTGGLRIVCARCRHRRSCPWPPSFPTTRRRGRCWVRSGAGSGRSRTSPGRLAGSLTRRWLVPPIC